MIEIVDTAPNVEGYAVMLCISNLREDPRESWTIAKTSTFLAAGKYMEAELSSLLLVRNCEDPMR
jgi:hypothetical protein